jgi:L-lactate dehydrogenase complex protein LldF
MQANSHDFPANATRALKDVRLQGTLGVIEGNRQRRAATIARLPEWEDLREAAKAIKQHTLRHLDFYLERYEQRVTESGGTVHWARTSAEACAIITEIAHANGAKLIAKGKSMIGEEIGLNDHLEAAGLTPIETDLGEYIIQLRGEPPSHIVMPALHLSSSDIADTFRSHHADLDPKRPLDQDQALLDEARTKLRQAFLSAEIGITGANFLIADSGSSIIVTNEGNGDLSQSLPRIHIVLASIDKLVPTFEDAAVILRLLARSATAQEFTSYMTVSTGPRRPGDAHGPQRYHVVLLDNGRSAMLGTEFEDMLRCIRCAACLNHCPVYNAVGGHAYGWVYPGPMGAVLTPSLVGIEEAGHLPNASTFCGRCEEVCPMKIPLPKMMRHWRERQFSARLGAPYARWGIGIWGFFATRPRLYRPLAAAGAWLLGRLGAKRGAFSFLPLASGWTATRDMPAPQGRSFQALYAERRRR